MQKTRLNLFNISGLYALTLFITAATAILCNPSIASKGAVSGLKICSSVVIPALFPFTAVSIFFQKSGAIDTVGKIFNCFSQKIFKIGGSSFAVVLLSLISGYPIGAKIIDEMYSSKAITKSEALNLLKYSVNPSPAFFISVIGYNLLGSKNIGVILLTANLLACFLIMFLNRFSYKRVAFTPKTYKSEHTVSLSDAFVQSVSQSAKTIISICAFVTLFSCISELLKTIITSTKLSAILTAFLEITFGAVEISKIGIPVYLYSFLLAFGGLSTICQVKQAAGTLKPTFIYIIFYRVIHGITATLLSLILFKIFPQATSVISNSVDIKFSGFPLFLPSIAQLLMAIVFLAYLKPNEKPYHN